MLTEKYHRGFSNGSVYLLNTEDGFPVETTDTFLPFYTKDAIGRKQNKLDSYELGSRAERWMVGVSVMSGCPVRCKFCATGKLKKWRNLTANEIVEQVMFVVKNNWPAYQPNNSKEFKINLTRMGEMAFNLDSVREAIFIINSMWPKANLHFYVSTIGVRGTDFSWIKDNITLQISLHSLDEERRNWLIPINNKMTLEELGQIRTNSNLKTTVNMTLVDESDFDINKLTKYFDPKYFFIKLSPINPNSISDLNNLGKGAITAQNLA